MLTATPLHGTCLPTDAEQIARWDDNALSRWHELVDNGDASYRALTNLVLSYIGEHPEAGHRQLRALDVGCGLGFMSQSLGRQGHLVVGVDPSVESIRLAEVNNASTQVSFRASTLQAYHSSTPLDQFDVIVVNMALHCVSHLTTFIESCSAKLAPGGFILVTLPNPETYLQSRIDLSLGDIDLRESQVLEVPFRISGHDPHPRRVFFYHRTIRDYISIAASVKLRVSNFKIPDQIGPGRPRDIALFELQRAS